VAFRKRLSRSQVLTFFAKQPRCTVAMEACATAHEWGRTIGELGHEIRLIPPAYVKPFVKRQKNDTSDAEAIAEAAARPTMRFVAVKTEEQQARSMIFRTRSLVRDIGAVYLEQISILNGKIGDLENFDARLSVEPTHHACRQCQALARSPQWRSRPLRRPCRPSSVAATLLLG
jgi:transposase